MNEQLGYLEFFTGLPLAVGIGLIVLLIVWRVGKRRGWFDERHKRANERAMSISWIATTAGILIIWMIITFIEGPGLAFWLITSLWAIHMVSLGVGSMIANKKQ